jgi:type IV secretory pathway TraG/TraD family ATPase VirD4
MGSDGMDRVEARLFNLSWAACGLMSSAGRPSAFFWWWFAYDAYARPIFVEGAYIAASGDTAAIVVAVVMSVWRAREVKGHLPISNRCGRGWEQS